MSSPFRMNLARPSAAVTAVRTTVVFAENHGLPLRRGKSRSTTITGSSTENRPCQGRM